MPENYRALAVKLEFPKLFDKLVDFTKHEFCGFLDPKYRSLIPSLSDEAAERGADQLEGTIFDDDYMRQLYGMPLSDEEKRIFQESGSLSQSESNTWSLRELYDQFRNLQITRGRLSHPATRMCRDLRPLRKLHNEIRTPMEAIARTVEREIHDFVRQVGCHLIWSLRDHNALNKIID